MQKITPTILIWRHGSLQYKIPFPIADADVGSRFMGLLQEYDEFQIKHNIMGDRGQAKITETSVTDPALFQPDIRRRTQQFDHNPPQPLLKIWHIPQIPMPAFYWHVPDLREAKQVLEILATYDLWLLAQNLKKDYANTGGLVYWNEAEDDWLEWETEWGFEINKIPDVVLENQTYLEIFNNYIGAVPDPYQKRIQEALEADQIEFSAEDFYVKPQTLNT